MLFLLSWILGIMAFCLFDALVGFGVEFDGNKLPPLALAAAFWPIVLPVMMILGFVQLLASLKTKRIERQEKRRRLRVAAQQEMELALKQVDEEISRAPHETTYQNHT